MDVFSVISLQAVSRG